MNGRNPLSPGKGLFVLKFCWQQEFFFPTVGQYGLSLAEWRRRGLPTIASG
jgi:hypothetical protein